MDKSGKRVRSAEEEWLASLDSASDSRDLEAVGKPRDVTDRLREMERELAGSARPAHPTQPTQAQSEPTVGEQPSNPLVLIFGLGMTAAGAYLVMEHVTVFSGNLFWGGFWGGVGQTSIGLTLLPLLVGIGLLVYGKSTLGWALTGLGALIVLLDILTSLHMVFRPTSLFEAVLMFGLIAAGLGLTLRSMRKA